MDYPAFDIQSIKPPRGQMDGSGKFSPNLYHWLRRQWGGRFNGRGLEQHPSVFRDDAGVLWIGRLDDTGCFIGARLFRVLSKPTQEVYAWTKRSQPGIKELKSFWPEYRRIGRCAIDKGHTAYFLSDAARWETKGNVRSCRWCGKHKQRLKTKVRVERDQAWVAAVWRAGSPAVSPPLLQPLSRRAEFHAQR